MKKSKPIFHNKDGILLHKLRCKDNLTFEVLTPYLGAVKDNTMIRNLYLSRKQAKTLLELLINEFWKPNAETIEIIENVLASR